MAKLSTADIQGPECALYRHFDAEGNLLYIGVSLSAARRLSEHQAKPWAKQIASVSVEWLETKALALLREAKAIKLEKPRFNVVGNGHPVLQNLVGFDGRHMTPEQFKQARQTLGLTQSQCAQWLGITLRNVQQWEAGERGVNPTAVILMGAYLDGWRPTTATS